MTTPKGGAPIKQVDYEKLDKLCAIHCTGEECASILDVDYDTLNAALKRDGNVGFSDYFKKKSAVGKMSLRRKQIEMALAGSVPLLIWMGKQQLDQHDKQQTEVTTIDPVSDEERAERIAALLNKAGKSRAKQSSE